jgi:hypothetical protein
MNVFTFYTERAKLMDLQESNDARLKGLPCADAVAMFLLYERSRTREQIQSISQQNLWSINSYINDVHALNRSNLLAVQNILSGSNSCAELKQIYLRKSDRY